ncbi:endoplasmic reticulum oxidoreductin-1-like protein [Tanacetum coccineum]
MSVNQNGYRCLDLNMNKIILSRHVTFDETVFPYGSMTPYDSPSYTFLDTSPNIIHQHIISKLTSASPLPTTTITSTAAPPSPPRSPLQTVFPYGEFEQVVFWSSSTPDLMARALTTRKRRTDDVKCHEGKPEAVVDHTLDAKAFRGLAVVDNPWTNDDETDNDDMTYVNVLLNPVALQLGEYGMLYIKKIVQNPTDLSSFFNSVVLSTSNDRWYFSLSSSGEFSVKDTRLAIDDLVLPSHSEPTRWVKLIPIKINVFMWRARRGCLPTRYNLVQKGVILESTSCPVCFSDEEDVHHLLFRCSLSQEVLHRVCRWWEVDFQLFGVRSQNGRVVSFIRFRVIVEGFLEGVLLRACGLFGDFGTFYFLMLISRLDRSFLRILSLPPFFGVIVDSSGESCQEKKVLYKLISGLHASISWGANLQLMHDHVLKHPERVQNLYFTFLFVLRAVTKAAPYLEEAEYDSGSGNHLEDLKAHSLIQQFVHNPKLQAACPLPFDETKLWQAQSGPELKQQIQKQFRNIRSFDLSTFSSRKKLIVVLFLMTLLVNPIVSTSLVDTTLPLKRNKGSMGESASKKPELFLGKKASQKLWMFKAKEEQNSWKRYKARLVVKGFQQKRGVDYNEIFSPVVKMIIIQLVLSIVAVGAFLCGSLE